MATHTKGNRRRRKRRSIARRARELAIGSSVGARRWCAAPIFLLEPALNPVFGDLADHAIDCAAHDCRRASSVCPSFAFPYPIWMTKGSPAVVALSVHLPHLQNPRAD
jgi:hypothetical protein